ncbi:MAG TPA: PIN domain-containing protein [Pyrinomonadaceae bacterium]|nr:PIN domain-containing protein [Pyrinomonadaceae bacterium]
MIKTFVDTFYIVALVNKRDEFHEKAKELVLEFDNQNLLTTDAVLLEIGNSLARSYKQKSIQIIDEFLSSEEIEIIRLDEILFEKAFELYKTHADKSWGLVDCISFVVMKERGITDALTCDKHFSQAGFRALLLDSVN